MAQHRSRSPFRAVLTAAALMVLSGACGSAEPATTTTSPTMPAVDPAARAVRIETTGCGFAGDRTGSGIAVGGATIVTAAHLVVKSAELAVTIEGGPPQPAVVQAVDLARDLARLAVGDTGLPPVATAAAVKGDLGQIVGGAQSGTVPYEVTGVVRISIEEVLGTERHWRMGYELRAPTVTGDSGAGAYDAAGRLIGMAFAIDDTGTTTWITSTSEIDDFLAATAAATTPLRCDPAISRLELP